MSVRIRFKRVGRPHAPYFRLVAIDKKKSRDAKPIEVLGAFNPRQGKKADTVKVDRIRYWLSVGAAPTDSALKTLKKLGIWDQVNPRAAAKA